MFFHAKRQNREERKGFLYYNFEQFLKISKDLIEASLNHRTTHELLTDGRTTAGHN